MNKSIIFLSLTAAVRAQLMSANVLTLSITACLLRFWFFQSTQNPTLML